MAKLRQFGLIANRGAKCYPRVNTCFTEKVFRALVTSYILDAFTALHACVHVEYVLNGGWGGGGVR